VSLARYAAADKMLIDIRRCIPYHNNDVNENCVHHLRIISGTLKGRRLASFKGRSVRPTSDRVRESLFNILTVLWEGKTVLDLFAGTGALGIEALSRGASHVIFVEHDVHAHRVLGKNIALLDLTDRCTILKLSAEAGIGLVKKKRQQCDIIFLDPPYDQQLADRTVSLLAEHDMIGNGGVIVVEHHVREVLSDCYGKLIMSDQRVYGNTGLSFFVSRQPDLS
jgi:16S rRNA (guanine(966)-N(2))-methyltransferase RsmD